MYNYREVIIMSTIQIATISANKTSNVARAASRSAGSTVGNFVPVILAEPFSLQRTNSNDDAQALLAGGGPSGYVAINGTNVLADPDIIRFGKDALIQGKYTTDGDLSTLTTFNEICTTGLIQSRDGRWVDENGAYVNVPQHNLAYPVVSASGDLGWQDGDSYPGHFNFRGPTETVKKLLDERNI